VTASQAIDVEATEKRAAGFAAVSEVRSGMVLGLGTGSTVRFFLEALSHALQEGSLQGVSGVPTSLDTEARCRALGIPVVELTEGTRIDLAVDGADEVSPTLDLVKGLGGALLREKIVAQAALRFVIIVDSQKEVPRLGTRAPVPVEILPFGWRAHLPFFRDLGADPVPRKDLSGELVHSDNGNVLVDLGFPAGIQEPAALERALQARSGIVENGLFLGMADRVWVGRERQAEVRDRVGGRGR